MKTLLTAISGHFPMWKECIEHNLQLVDNAIFRTDPKLKGTEFLAVFYDFCYEFDYKGKSIIIFEGKEEITSSNFRHDLINMAHKCKQIFNTSYVLFPDEDEKMPDIDYSFDGQLVFDYKMITENNEPIFKYPPLPHVKAFKYYDALNYDNYLGFAKVRNGSQTLPEKYVKEPIEHYCFYKKNWHERKVKSINERYPDYFKKYPIK